MNVKDAPFKAAAVANYFLELGMASNSITPMKLLKLLYYAHGWHLAIEDGKPLLIEPIEAWKFGPVVATIYHEFSDFEFSPINRLATALENPEDIMNIPIDSWPTPRLNLDPDGFLQRLLHGIWDSYGHLSGGQLSALTHKEDSPWYKVWFDQGGKDRKRAIIPNSLIQEYFTKQLIPNAAAQSAEAR